MRPEQYYLRGRVLGGRSAATLVRWSWKPPSSSSVTPFFAFKPPSSFFSNGKLIPNHAVINRKERDEYYSICMPALVSCCFVWVSQTVAMTTTSSYWTDVICDIILNGKEKEEETVSKIRRIEQDPKRPPQRARQKQSHPYQSPGNTQLLGKPALGCDMNCRLAVTGLKSSHTSHLGTVTEAFG